MKPPARDTLMLRFYYAGEITLRDLAERASQYHAFLEFAEHLEPAPEEWRAAVRWEFDEAMLDLTAAAGMHDERTAALRQLRRSA